MDRVSALHLLAGRRSFVRSLAVVVAAMLTAAATSQSFSAAATGSLLASASISGPTQGYGPGPITATPVTVTASAPFGMGTATASLGATSLQASLGATLNGSASANIALLLQAPPGAGARVTVFGLLSGLGNFGLSMAGRSYAPDAGGSIVAEAIVPAGGLAAVITCSVIPPPFSQSRT